MPAEECDLERERRDDERARVAALPVSAADVLRWAAKLRDRPTDSGTVLAIADLMETRAHLAMADATSLATELANLVPLAHVETLAVDVARGAWSFADAVSLLVGEAEDGDAVTADVRDELVAQMRRAIVVRLKGGGAVEPTDAGVAAGPAAGEGARQESAAGAAGRAPVGAR